MAPKNLAKIYSAELEGINARLIEVEVDMNVGLHSFTIVGLADKALNEARERVNSAIKNCGARPPNRENRRITINLAPADVKKAGSQYDLAIALGYLVATKQIAAFETGDKIFIGELALDGRLRSVNGALNIAEMARALGFKYFFLPEQNAGEASAIGDVVVVPLRTLSETIRVLEGNIPVPKKREVHSAGSIANTFPDLSEIVGQENAKRALTVAASGSHNVLLIGPPGVGKSMLAQAVAGILPDLGAHEAIEVTKVWSAAGLSPGQLAVQRPFRAPHETASSAALMGGGAEPRPGEVSLAHRGVLFLDEFPEFPRNVLEALRDPMESGIVRISRAKGTIIFPAKFMLVAAMNPCPCGYFGDEKQVCKCTPYEVIKYQKKISGPLLDRIDVQVKVGRVELGELRKGAADGATSTLTKGIVERARAIQWKRFENLSRRMTATNAEMSSREVRGLISLDASAEKFLASLGDGRISPRAYYRILKVARTIADIEGQEGVAAEHLAEAFSYRLRM